jgi:uncharacterized protein (TIGR02996 family)
MELARARGREAEMPMSNNEAFLWAITEDTNDDGGRLVYADWLDERGGVRRQLLRRWFLKIEAGLCTIWRSRSRGGRRCG